MNATSSRKLFFPIALVLALGTASAVAAADTPDSENGRYVFKPTADGLLRLDGKAGTVSTCRKDSAAGWACYAVPEERKALEDEIGRLQAENDKLKAQLAAPGPVASAKPLTPDNQNKIEIPLPSDQDMDRVMSFVQRAWKRLVDMANQVQKDVAGNGKI